MNTDNFGFEELELWKMVRIFKKDIRELTKQFSTEEKFRLTDQVIRSSRSINALITEGHGRFTYPAKFIIVYRQEAHLQKQLTI
jgi:four helix bundle protein